MIGPKGFGRVFDLNRRACVFIGGAVLIGASSLTFISGPPSLWAPLPISLLLLALRGVPAPLLSLLPSIGFWALGWRLWIGAIKIPWYSVALFGIAALLNLGWFAVAWEYGVKYQGTLHTAIVAAYNAVLVGLLLGLWFAGRRAPRYLVSYAFHWVLFLWLGWCAFPYLGELI